MMSFWHHFEIRFPASLTADQKHFLASSEVARGRFFEQTEENGAVKVCNIDHS